LALALGGMTRGISPLQMAAAYSMFPAQGKQAGTFTVSKITDTKNKVIYKDRSSSKRVISSSNAKVMDNILKAVVSQGTGSNARIAISSGGKTGTTEGRAGNNTARDLWYVGYTSELVTAVWVGNSDNSEIKGLGAYGGTVAGPVWRDYMNKLINKGLFKERPEFVESDDEPVVEPPQPETPPPGESDSDPNTEPVNPGPDDNTTPNPDDTLPPDQGQDNGNKPSPEESVPPEGTNPPGMNQDQ